LAQTGESNGKRVDSKFEMTQDLPNDGAVGDSRDEPQQPLTAKWTRQDASWLVIRFDSGKAWIDVPETAVPVVRTTQAVATTSPAGLVAHVGPQRTTVTVAHGTVAVSELTYEQEISREEAIDASTDGALGKPSASTFGRALLGHRTAQNSPAGRRWRPVVPPGRS
jgi:hypothetical protein